MYKIVLDVPYIEQGERSANCGPCSVKMVLDYYQIKDPKGKDYKVHGLNRLLQTTKEFGCEEKNILDFLSRFEIPHNFIRPKDMIQTLERGHPLLVSFRDELFDGHYAVIVGAEKLNTNRPLLIFNDPWPDFGKHYKRYIDDFYDQLKDFNNWVIALT